MSAKQTSVVGIGTVAIRYKDRYVYETRKDPTKWRLAYEEVEIVGETRVSWIVARRGESATSFDAVKIKKREWPGSLYPSWETVEREHWINENWYQIGEAVRSYRGKDRYDILKRVAEIIGYMEKP